MAIIKLQSDKKRFSVGVILTERSDEGSRKRLSATHRSYCEIPPYVGMTLSILNS